MSFGVPGVFSSNSTPYQYHQNQSNNNGVDSARMDAIEKKMDTLLDAMRYGRR